MYSYPIIVNIFLMPGLEYQFHRNIPLVTEVLPFVPPTIPVHLGATIQTSPWKNSGNSYILHSVTTVVKKISSIYRCYWRRLFIVLSYQSLYSNLDSVFDYQTKTTCTFSYIWTDVWLAWSEKWLKF